MGYSLCFGQFLAILKMFSFFECQLFFRAVFCIEQLECVCTDVFRMFQAIYFMTQTEYFAWARTFALWPFWPFSKCSHFSNISCFFESFFAYKDSNVFLGTFFACFRQFYFLTQSEYFAWPIAFALWPFLAILNMLSFFEYQLFFRVVFCIEQL